MSSSVQTPLWYRVFDRQLSFNEFVERYKDRNFIDKETLPIYILAVLYEHDQYISGTHVLHNFIGEGGISERSVKYFYLCWALGASYKDKNVFCDGIVSYTFQHFNIKLPQQFSDAYLYDWITAVLRSFFSIGVLVPPNVEVERGNMEHLKQTLNYLIAVQGECFIMPEKTTEKVYKLSRAHNLIVELKSFFQGIAYPTILKPYRKDKIFFKSVVDCYWPAVLKTLEMEQPFDDKELKILNKAHIRLYEHGDMSFVTFYTKSISQLFGRESAMVTRLLKYWDPTPDNDSMRAEQFLRSLNPHARRNYLPQTLPVSNKQVAEFVDRIRQVGIAEALKPYILVNKQIIEAELSRIGSTLKSDTIIMNQTEIFMYPIKELVFYVDDSNHVYVFLREELSNYKSIGNPYNRQPLPQYIFMMADPEHKSLTYEDMWATVLRHNIDLQGGGEQS